MTNQQAEKKKVTVCTEDQARLRRLYEEISGRSEEIARITSRYMGVQLNPVKRITFFLGEDSATQVHIEMEPVIVVGDNTICYLDPPGICCMCPC